MVTCSGLRSSLTRNCYRILYLYETISQSTNVTIILSRFSVLTKLEEYKTWLSICALMCEWHIGRSVGQFYCLSVIFRDYNLNLNYNACRCHGCDTILARCISKLCQSNLGRRYILTASSTVVMNNVINCRVLYTTTSSVCQWRHSDVMDTTSLVTLTSWPRYTCPPVRLSDIYDE